MNLSTYDFVHLAIHAMGGEIKGKTKLQKTMYFLGIMTDQLDDLGYRAHFYGPYSSEVADATGKLESLGFLESKTSTWGMDSRGFELTRTDYSLTDDGKVVAELKREAYSELYDKLLTVSTRLKDAGDLDYVKLSIAAKTYYLAQKSGSATEQEIAQQAKQLGWDVSSEQIEVASRFLQSLALVPVSGDKNWETSGGA